MSSGAPGLCPLDAQVTRPERCDSSGLQEWLPVFAGAHPFQERAGCFAPLVALEVAERVVMAVAQEARQDAEACSAQRPRAPAETAGELRVVSVDGQGVPMLTEAAVTHTAQWGTGAPRPTQPEALGGVSDTGDPKPRAPAALAERLGAPEAARARRPGPHGPDDTPRAQQGRREALGAAAADGDAPRPGGLRQRRPAPQPHPATTAEIAPGEARHRHHLLSQPPALDAVRRIPGRGRAARDRCRGGGRRGWRDTPDGGRRPALEPGRGRRHADVALAQEEPRP